MYKQVLVSSQQNLTIGNKTTRNLSLLSVLHNIWLFYNNYRLNNQYKVFSYLSKFWNKNTKINLTTNHLKSSYNKRVCHKYNTFLRKSFSVYLSVSVFYQNTTIKPHYSFMSLFFTRSSHGKSSLLLSVSKFYKKYVTTFHLIFTMFFYKLKVTFFGNFFLKNEIISLNWAFLPQNFLKLKLNQLLLFVTPLSRRGSLQKVVYFITKNTSTNVFIFDLLYHQTTIKFLKKTPTLLIGPVPITHDIKNLDIVIPVSTDNIFSQLFLIKTILLVSKWVEYKKYLRFLKTWHSFTQNTL